MKTWLQVRAQGGACSGEGTRNPHSWCCGHRGQVLRCKASSDMIYENGDVKNKTQTAFYYIVYMFIFHKTVYVCAQACRTLCNSMDCSPPGSSVRGIFQARLLEWVAISFSRGSSGPRD